MKKFVFVFLALLITAGCIKPINNVESLAIPMTAQQLSLDRIEAIIISAGQKRGWQMKRVSPGYLAASQIQQKYSATVDIRFDQRTYSILYRSSTGLKEQDGTIHARYRNWIVILQKEIDTGLANANYTGS